MPTVAGALLLLGGAYLIYEGLRGSGSSVNRGAERAERGKEEKGIEVRESVTIARPAEELYRHWRSFENLPSIMRHLESVEVRGGGRSHWVAKGPLNTRVAWDAETTEDRPNERIAWRSLEGATVPNEGAVTFREAPGGRGTEVHVALLYRPPLGSVGAAFAKLFGEEPAQQVHEDLWRFKQRLEAGEVATTQGQPSGRA